MPITVEAYTNPNFTAVDPRTGEQGRVSREKALITGLGNATAGSEFLPSLPTDEYAAFLEKAVPLFGPATPEIMTVNPGLRRAIERGEVPQQTIVVGGFCALPKKVNADLEPSGGPGSSRLDVWMPEHNIIDSRPLPWELTNAVDFLREKAPPLTLPGLLMAAAPTPNETILFAEIDFFTEWTLSKLVRNMEMQPRAARLENARASLAGFFYETYLRATQAWSLLRTFVCQELPTGGVRQVTDSAVAREREAAIREFAARVDYTLPPGALDSAVQAAAFYGPVTPQVLRIPADTLTLIAEGQSNLVIPDVSGAKARPFNTIRRDFLGHAATAGLWNDDPQNKTGGQLPALASYAPMTLAPLWAGTSLDMASPYAVPNENNYGAFDFTAGFPLGAERLIDLRQNPVYLWGTAMPQSAAARPLLRAMQDIAARSLGSFEGDSPKTQRKSRSTEMGELASHLAAVMQADLRSIFDPLRNDGGQQWTQPNLRNYQY